MILVALVLISALAFFYYGGETLFADPPRGEYERYGMPKARVLAGSAQLLGGAGPLFGLRYTPVGVAAAAGLTLMMLLGVIVRYRVRDAPRLMVPAGTLGSINAALIVLFVVN